MTDAKKPTAAMAEDEMHPLDLAEIEQQQFDAAIASAFRMGARACREMLARFVENSPPTDLKVMAGSMRANWVPSWGDDLGPPDEYPVELGTLEGRADAEKFAASAVAHALDLLDNASLEPAAPVEDGEVVETEMCDACNGSGFGVADTYCGKCGGAGGYPPQPPAADALVSEAVSLFRAFCRGLEAGPSNRRWCAADSEHAIGEFSAALAKLQGGGEQ